MGVPLCSAGHTQGLSSQETPEEWQKCCSQPSCRLRGGTKGLSHGDLPLWASREEQGRKGSWSCHISAWHRHEPQSRPWSWSSSTAPSTADSTVAMQLGEYWDCGRQRSKKGLLVAKKFSQKQLALGADCRMHRNSIAALPAHRTA